MTNFFVKISQFFLSLMILSFDRSFTTFAFQPQKPPKKGKGLSSSDYAKLRKQWAGTIDEQLKNIDGRCALYIGGEGLGRIAKSQGITTVFDALESERTRNFVRPHEPETWRLFSELYASSTKCTTFYLYLNLAPQSWKHIGNNSKSTWADYFHNKVFYKDELPALLENTSVKKLIISPVIGYTHWPSYVPEQFESINDHSRVLEQMIEPIDLDLYRKRANLGEKIEYKNMSPPLMIDESPDGHSKEGFYNPMDLRKSIDESICQLAMEYKNTRMEDLHQSWSMVTEAEHINYSKEKVYRFGPDIEELKKYKNENRNLFESFQRTAEEILQDEICDFGEFKISAASKAYNATKGKKGKDQAFLESLAQWD